MAGGPVAPFSVSPDGSGDVFPNIHVGGTNSREDVGTGVAASIGSDRRLALRFEMPPSLPTGTAKLRCLSIANATSGAAKVNPKWASVAPEEAADTVTLNAETTQTVTWAAGDADVYKELKVTLDADTVVAGEVVVMEVVFETTNWTLAQVLTWNFSVIWE